MFTADWSCVGNVLHKGEVTEETGEEEREPESLLRTELTESCPGFVHAFTHPLRCSLTLQLVYSKVNWLFRAD